MHVFWKKAGREGVMVTCSPVQARRQEEKERAERAVAGQKERAERAVAGQKQKVEKCKKAAEKKQQHRDKEQLFTSGKREVWIMPGCEEEKAVKEELRREATSQLASDPVRGQLAQLSSAEVSELML